MASFELWTTIARKFLRHAKGGKERALVANQASRASQISAYCGAEDLHPARESITDNQVVAASIIK